MVIFVEFVIVDIIEVYGVVDVIEIDIVIVDIIVVNNVFFVVISFIDLWFGNGEGVFIF